MIIATGVTARCAGEPDARSTPAGIGHVRFDYRLSIRS